MDYTRPGEEVMPGSACRTRVPVTIVCGALGAGKSTFLRHVLSARHGKRIAVIENEFGDGIGVEGLILKDGVEGAPADGFVELANGCVCCSVRGGFVLALEALMRRRDRFDYILVEASGMASPGPVASLFWSDELGDDALVTLDAVVAVVDAVHVRAQLAERRPRGAVHEVAQQIAFADVVLLNKADAAGPGGVAAARRVVAALNRTCAVHETTRGAVPLERVLDLAAFDVTRVLPLADGAGCGDERGDVECGAACSVSACAHGAHSSHGGGAPPGPAVPLLTAREHAHDGGIASVVLSRAAPVDLRAFRLFVGQLLWRDAADAAAVAGDGGDGEHDGDARSDASPPPPALVTDDGTEGGAAGDAGPTTAVIMRGKGVVYAVGGDSAGVGTADAAAAAPVRHIFQAVHELFDVQPATGAAATATDAAGTTSRVLLIGRGLDAAALQVAFEALPGAADGP